MDLGGGCRTLSMMYDRALFRKHFKWPLDFLTYIVKILIESSNFFFSKESVKRSSFCGRLVILDEKYTNFPVLVTVEQLHLINAFSIF